MTKHSFLVRCRDDGTYRGKTHLWTGDDTACKLWSTGGMVQGEKWKRVDAPPTELCQLCHCERLGIQPPVPQQGRLFE